MTTALDRVEANLAALRTWAEEGKPLPFIDEGRDFIVGPPMDEKELEAIERKYKVVRPPEYRAFLARFGDTFVGPGNQFRKVNEGLTARSKNRFPLAEPFLGTLSPAHQRLPEKVQWEDYGRLLKDWEPIPKEDGVLAISDYGCAIYGALILNGPFCGKVWILQTRPTMDPSPDQSRFTTNRGQQSGQLPSIRATIHFSNGTRVG